MRPLTWKSLLRRMMIPLMLLSVQPFAQGQDQNADEGAAGERGVARLSLINGDVSIRRGESGDWVAGAVNAPLLAEDRIMTGPGARAEVQFDYYNRIRLAGDSEIRLAQLDNQQYQIQVARGTVTFSALKGSDAQVEISTPGASVRPVSSGEYRVTVNDDGAAEITIRSGEAEIFSPDGTQRLKPGKTMIVRLGPANQSEFQMVAAIPVDSWDKFNQQRDKELSKAASTYQYVSRDIYGAEDLSGNGDWVYVAPYGYCWRPYASADWAPYQNGRWTWLDWYGWSWVSYDSWGWAPYHYGRWFWGGSSWCWFPGAAVGVRYAWSPALVGWFGWNSYGGFGGGIGFGWGAVGWVPLAPFEPCYRWWGGRAYGGYRNGAINNYGTIVNNVNVTNVYRNARVSNGVTVVNGNDFTRGASGRAMRVSESDLARANVARGAVPIAPSRESLRMSDRQVQGSALAARSTANHFYSRTQAQRVDRVPFEQQRQTMEQVSRRAIAGGADTGSAGAARGADSSRQPDTQWGRFGDPSTGGRGNPAAQQTPEATGGRQFGQGPSRQTAQPSNEATRSWRSFGDPGASRTTEPARTGSGTVGNTPRTDVQRSQPMPRGTWSTGSAAEPSAPRSNGGYVAPSGGGGYNAPSRSAAPSAPSGGGGGYSAPARSSGSSSGGGGGGSPAPRSPGGGGGGGGGAGSSGHSGSGHSGSSSSGARTR
jgi:hypothetical protein